MTPISPLSAAPVAARPTNDHDGLRKVSRLVAICAGFLTVAAIVLVTTALHVAQSIDRSDLAAERQRAANAVDAVVASYGPLTPERAVMLGRVAGLNSASLTGPMPDDPSVQQIPMLAGQGPSGTYLTWTRTNLAEQIFRQFAPIRLPFAIFTMLVVFAILLRIRWLVVDIDRQRRLAHQQSRSDPLTGLSNRLALETALEELTAARTAFAVMALDLDRFKHVNDAHGHAAGDDVLRTIASRLTRLIGPTDMLARVGGDEFVLLATTRTGVAALTGLARDCIAAIERPVPLQGGAASVGVSIGIVPAGAWYHTPVSLMGMADAALYRAKARRGSSYQFAGQDSDDVPAPRPLWAAS